MAAPPPHRGARPYPIGSLVAASLGPLLLVGLTIAFLDIALTFSSFDARLYWLVAAFALSALLTGLGWGTRYGMRWAERHART